MYDNASLIYSKKTVKRIPRYMWVTFISACIICFLIHGYMFANKLPNHDDIGHLFGSDYGVASGRWLLPLVLKLDGSLSMPWLIGVISVVLLAMSACLTVSVLRIRQPQNCILTAAVMVSFPTVAATFTYMFSADAYFLALLLACFAVYITNRYKYGFLCGIAAIAMSLGIYQSYIGFAAVLFVGILMLDTFDANVPVSQIILKGVKFFATLLAGILLYYLIVKLTTQETELVSYMGISSMGKISISQLPSLIYKAYKEYFSFFIRNNCGVHFWFMPYIFALTVVSGIYIIVLNIKNRHIEFKYIALTVVLAILYPLAGNAIYILAPSANVHLLMLYGMSAALLAAIAISEYFPQIRCYSKIQNFSGSIACWVIAISIALSSYSYCVYSNESYLKMDLCQKQAYSFSTRLLGTIQNVEDYDVNKPIVLVGSVKENSSIEPLNELEDIDMIGVMDMQDLIDCYTYGYFLRYYLGASNIIYCSDTKVAKDMENEVSIQNMHTYPLEGSIMVTNKFIIVKMGDK